MGEKVSRRELERVIEDVSRAREGLLWRREVEAEDIEALLDAARVLLEMQPASSDEVVETRCGLWRADERPEPWKGGFGSGWRAAEAHLLSKVGE